MKNLFVLIALMAAFVNVKAQADTTTAGNILYYEGKVEIGTEPTWTRAKIKAPVKRNQWIRTSPEAMVEIKWLNHGPLKLLFKWEVEKWFHFSLKSQKLKFIDWLIN